MPEHTITATKDTEFTIALQTIAAAGYLWKIESLPDDIQLLGNENQKPAGDIKVGDPTNQIFRLRALQEGEYKILFLLSRPWENKAIESHTVTVNVI